MDAWTLRFFPKPWVQYTMGCRLRIHLALMVHIVAGGGDIGHDVSFLLHPCIPTRPRTHVQSSKTWHI